MTAPINTDARSFRYFDIIMAVFVAVLLISNLASTKILTLGPFTFDGGTLLFPLSYIFGDILTEVYGYQRARKVIWTGFGAALLMSVVLWVVQILPPAADWPNQQAYESLLGFVPRIVLASLVAYFAGAFSNAFLLSKLKIRTKGKYLWVRTIGSTIIGEGIDTTIFCLVAFYGLFPHDVLIAIIVSNYLFKTGVEVIFTPLTYKIVGFLKKHEQVDVYDKGISYNPFRYF
jgi:queuosine precursor transporter